MNQSGLTLVTYNTSLLQPLDCIFCYCSSHPNPIFYADFFFHHTHRFRTRVRVFRAFSSARLKNEKKNARSEKTKKKRAFEKRKKTRVRKKREKKRAFEKRKKKNGRSKKWKPHVYVGRFFERAFEKWFFRTRVQFFKRAFEKTTFSNARLKKKKKKRPFFFTRVQLFERAFFFFFHVRVFRFWICAFSIFERAFETYAHSILENRKRRTAFGATKWEEITFLEPTLSPDLSHIVKTALLLSHQFLLFYTEETPITTKWDKRLQKQK